MKLWIIVVLATWMALFISRVEGKEIGFIENFSLADDRSKALAQLIPGTPEYYFYHCLHSQHTGDSEKVRELLAAWIKQHGYTGQVKEILNRQALLEYGRNPEKSLDHIRRELNLRFDHRREVSGEKTDDPVSLDPDLISIPRLMEIALSRYDNLEGFEDAGLDLLAGDRLNPDRRRDLLGRLERPLRPDLAGLVAADLQYKHSGGFGSLAVHERMVTSQLDACLAKIPGLLENPRFVMTYAARMAPDTDTDIRFDPSAREAYLDRLRGFAEPLPPVHNALKSHILYHLLDVKRSRGEYDRDLLLRYLSIPRNVGYMRSDYLERRDLRSFRVNLGVDFSAATQLPPVMNDEELVRDHLIRFFADADDYRPFAEFIREDYVKALFAETKMLRGIGDMERWYAMIDPNRYRELKDRVDLEFPASNRRFFDVDEPVSLDLEVKNVETLIIKVYELNAFNYYREHGAEVDTAVDLDGLTATREETIRYDAPPLRRIRRTFDFPRIDRPGLFVIDFIGNGKNSRAVIRKGVLRTITRQGAAGHEFIVTDERNRRRPEATLWTGGREYRADADGRITVPFSTDPGERPIILKDGNLASLETFHHQAESYRLAAGFHLSRESLIPGREAEVIIRPSLTVNGYAIPLSLLNDIRLTVSSIDRAGVASGREVSDFPLHPDRDSGFVFTVPENLARIEFTLAARIDPISRGDTEDLTASADFSVNEIDASMAVRDFFLAHVEGGYRVEVRGKNGEAVPDQPVEIELKHRFFRETVHTTLQSDSDGRIGLGPLTDIDWFQVSGPDGVSHTWRPLRDRCRYPETIHAPAGAPIRIPYVGEASGPDWRRFALLELRAGQYAADRTPIVKISDGYLAIDGLAPGDYELRLKEVGVSIRLRVTRGEATGDFLLSDHRILERRGNDGLQIHRIETGEKTIRVLLSHAGEDARLHLIATRFVPAFDAFSDLRIPEAPVPEQIRISRPTSSYLAGRRIGDEYRYVLERKYARKYPGNLLDRPELLLNPWPVRKTETAEDQARAGEAFAASAPPTPMHSAPADRGLSGLEGAVSFSNIDFLQETAVFRTNLKPDADGVVTIDRAGLGAYSQLHLIALDGEWTIYREISLPLSATPTRDLRMVRRLDPETPFTEQKRISMLSAGETLHIQDIATADFEVYDDLEKAYRLLETLSGDSTLREFGFILRWPKMADSEKGKTYSEYACHELDFFLFHKDPPFFETVIRPYLENKKDKTFMDDWLLGADLTRYPVPMAFSRLNIVEKILLFRGSSRDGNRIRRYVEDRFDLLPPDPEAFNTLFDTALKGSALEPDRFGMDDDTIAELLRETVAADREFAPNEVSAKSGMRSGVKADIRVESAAPPKAEAIMDAPLPAPGRLFQVRGDIEERRKRMRPLYQAVDKTREWVENNYYHLPVENQNEDRVAVNAFWRDFADSDPGKPFFSIHFPHAHRNFTEMMFALSVLDLPFEAGEPVTEIRETGFRLTAKSPLIVFHKEIRPAPTDEGMTSVMVSQNFFRPDDRYRYEGNERTDRFIRDEFLRGVPYGCQVAVSNPTSSRRKLNLLAQIPAGSVPLHSGFHSRSIPMAIDPYSTRTLEYHFYFPKTGRFDLYPVQVAIQDAVAASGAPVNFNVVSFPSRQDTESWTHISQSGTPEAVLAFLKEQNPERIALEKIAFRMKDRGFFQQTLSVLRSRLAYDPTLWSYGIHHRDVEAISEYLAGSVFARRCGLFIESPLLTVHPVEHRLYEHREYKPLVHARAHRLGDRRQILNDRFYEQYHRFLTQLGYKPGISTEDRMAAIYYLLLQDRVEAALDFFERIDPEQVRSRIQYDYLSTYLAFYRGDVETARRVAGSYIDFPVERWRDLFRVAVAQLDELAGTTAVTADEKDRDRRMEALAASEPSLALTVADGRATLDYRNLEACTVHYYPMDIELLFSRNPFVRQETGHFAFIRPDRSDEISLPGDRQQVRIDIPEEYRTRNLMIEVIGDGLRETGLYYANSLDLRVIDNYGYLMAADADTHEPLSAVYVKVYARMKGGEILFYKDGYTDLRGRFDYVSLSTDEPERVDRFAILVLSESRGAATREAAPPRR